MNESGLVVLSNVGRNEAEKFMALEDGRQANGLVKIRLLLRPEVWSRKNLEPGISPGWDWAAKARSEIPALYTRVGSARSKGGKREVWEGGGREEEGREKGSGGGAPVGTVI